MILSEFIISQRDSALALFATYVTIALRIFFVQHITALFLFVAEIMLSCRSTGQQVDETIFNYMLELTSFPGFSRTLEQENESKT